MKEKIIIFAIGLLVGAVLSTGAFLVYSKTSKCNRDHQMQMNMQQRGQVPQGNSQGMPGQNNQGMMPNQNNNQNGQPPEMPNNNQQNNN